ncbi:LegC family aminotransferase [Cryomorphaceae bacterium 1068]|nr:LegC family aminotransferase [Cryomorphaceae bacterium 1068]
MFKEITDFIRAHYGHVEGFIPLHEPRFLGNEKKYLNDVIDSTFVSSVGQYVNRFEQMICDITGAKYAVATMNGTAALHVALILAGVTRDDEVITQPLSFIATANAISYTGARMVFVDVDRDTLGLSPEHLEYFLKNNTTVNSDGDCINSSTGKRIAAVVPMHTFGFPCRIEEIVSVCSEYQVSVVEDAAESLGSTYNDRHTGTFGLAGTFSFNGNKLVTSGGGGCVLTNDEKLARLAKHITTTAKTPHRWEYMHDMVGYNYRLTNLSAALACAQLEQLGTFIANKRETALSYRSFLSDKFPTVNELPEAHANYWLNAIIMRDKSERDAFLKFSNDQNIGCRPIWQLLNRAPMFQNMQSADLSNAEWLEERVVNLPSSVTER